MLYEATPDNLRFIVRAVGTLKKEQILRFFSDTVDSMNLEYYIKELTDSRIFDYDETRELVSWHTRTRFIDAIVEARIKAFWIITSFRSNAIKEIDLLPYPSQFQFITHNNGVYDITVVNMPQDAMLAQSARNRTLYEGVEDEVNHIALVSNERLGLALGPYGFDSFCTLDKDMKPQYGTWN